MSEPGWPFGGRPKPRQAWSLWKAGRLMACEVNAHPLGHEVRLYVQGDFLYSRAFASVEQAEAEAEERKHDLIAEGWAEPPPMPE